MTDTPKHHMVRPGDPIRVSGSPAVVVACDGVNVWAVHEDAQKFRRRNFTGVFMVPFSSDMWKYDYARILKRKEEARAAHQAAMYKGTHKPNKLIEKMYKRSLPVTRDSEEMAAPADDMRLTVSEAKALADWRREAALPKEDVPYHSKAPRPRKRATEPGRQRRPRVHSFLTKPSPEELEEIQRLDDEYKASHVCKWNHIFRKNKAEVEELCVQLGKMLREQREREALERIEMENYQFYSMPRLRRKKHHKNKQTREARSVVYRDKVHVVEGDCAKFINTVSGEVSTVVGPCWVYLKTFRVIEKPRKATEDEILLYSSLPHESVPAEDYDEEAMWETITGETTFRDSPEVSVLTISNSTLSQLLGVEEADIESCLIPEGAFEQEVYFHPEPALPVSHSLPVNPSDMTEEMDHLEELFSLGFITLDELNHRYEEAGLVAEERPPQPPKVKKAPRKGKGPSGEPTSPPPDDDVKSNLDGEGYNPDHEQYEQDDF
ncbi:hypothetical protein Pelo_10189 [Pelomyxa schiedti]|nr:hypothetical protein Pelo_10189 [Pelomyxa schiedti]